MTHKKPTLYEQAVDEIVVAYADDDSAWEPPVWVSRTTEATAKVRDMANQENVYETLEQWAKASNQNLTMVFTDIVDSTRIGVEIGDRTWIENLFVHFSRAREVASKYDCYVVKSIGDAFMIAFRSAPEAILFALEFATDTGVEYIGIRVGINSGHVQIREDDIYGLNVNFTSRVQHELKGEGILVSDADKNDFEKNFGRRFTEVKFFRKDVSLRSFGDRTLWQVLTPEWRQAASRQRIKRKRLLNELPTASA